MTVEKNHGASDQGETPSWAWPVYAFVAWLATMLGYIARFKRTHRFKPDWRDSWDDLRQCEWLRDQLIAQGVAQLLAGQPLQLDDTKIELTPPATFGGPCPRTPFDMNHRFLAVARWAADPEAIVHERCRRLAKRAAINPLVAHGSTGALRAAHHEAVGVAAFENAAGCVALMVSSDRRERPSNHEGVLTKARGPPTFHRLPNAQHLSTPTRLRTHRHAYSARIRTFRYHTRSP